MKILILEDSRERIRIFKKHFDKKHELFIFDHVEDAKNAIDNAGPFERIYLDHDLDQRVFVDSDEDNTGYQLAKYIADKKVDADIILHTLNPFGAERMQSVLPNAKQISFDELFNYFY
jgi:hypothetical protein